MEFETRYTTITHALGEEVWEFIVGIELFVQSFAYWVNSFNISRFFVFNIEIKLSEMYRNSISNSDIVEC